MSALRHRRRAKKALANVASFLFVAGFWLMLFWTALEPQP
jgi:hypothetical protein